MTLMPRGPWPTVAARALDLADELVERARLCPPPGVTGLPGRPRMAYDRVMDAVNRLPRPLMVLGSLGLLASALVAPDWFEARMEALSRLPEALWWLIGAVLSLHFGARMQDRAIEARQAPAAPPAAPVGPDPAPAAPGADADLTLASLAPGANPALEAWAATRA